MELKIFINILILLLAALMVGSRAGVKRDAIAPIQVVREAFFAGLVSVLTGCAAFIISTFAILPALTQPTLLLLFLIALCMPAAWVFCIVWRKASPASYADRLAPVFKTFLCGALLALSPWMAGDPLSGGYFAFVCVIFAAASPLFSIILERLRMSDFGDGLVFAIPIAVAVGLAVALSFVAPMVL